ncbi:MAG TPA: zf-HC2 domain-containing protein [Blastocatellia bacterium]|nr:zf-HC2 domain-containing protein [Blastocatellia bacterium]
MTHLFSEEEWNDYIDGRIDEEARDRIEAHIIGCLSCWEFYERMATATRALTACGAGLRAAFALQDRRLNAGLRAVFAKINEAETAKRERPLRAIQQRLNALAEVMAPMCGSQTAIKALRAAAQVSLAASLESVTEDNWTSFLSSLKPIAAVMCGETGARLVWESGQF